LVNQAHNAFKANLKDASFVNLLEDKNQVGRVYFSTYQTMMGLIDEKMPMVHANSAQVCLT
jgi:type I restriction enzyme R subunit